MKTQLLSIVAFILLSGTLVMAQEQQIQNNRPVNKDGISLFEPIKDNQATFNGFNVKLGGAFTQQFQMLNHSNDGEGDELKKIKNGFNNAVANLNIDVQLDDGIRLEIITYLSSLHHTEAWVKGGYIQFDKLPFLKSEGIDKLMEKMTFKIGHMEINYGDGHFRRTDNGNAIFNPFVGNYVMDAFDSQIGAEAYFRTNGLILMAGITEGEIKGNIAANSPEDGYGPAFYGKVGYDKQINDELRLRLTGSVYTTEDFNNTNHLYDGDRTGSRYYNVIQEGSFRAGRYSPGFKKQVTSLMLNPYVKFQGIEFFGMMERATGANGSYDANDVWTYNVDDDDRVINQMSGEVIYRFLPSENLFVGARYNVVSGNLETEIVDDAKIKRIQLGAGWFLTKNILAKVEYVKQQYDGFDTGIYKGAQFDGLMIEAVIGF